jgi:hypothetical protein
MEMSTNVENRERDTTAGAGLTIVLLGTAGALVLLLVVAWILNVHRVLTGEVKIVPKEYGSLQREYGSFQGVILHYGGEKKVPPNSLAAILKDRPEPGMRMLRQGVDPWGTPFILRLRTITQADGTIDFIVTLRSAGPNRLDEDGRGDDIETVAHGMVLGIDRPQEEGSKEGEPHGDPSPAAAPPENPCPARQDR